MLKFFFPKLKPKTKRLTKIIHPNSRRALDLASKEYHKSKAIRSKEDFKQKTNALSRKMAWFKSLITANDTDTAKQEEEMITEEVKTKNVDTEMVVGDDFTKKNFFTLTDIHKIIEL